MSYAIIRIQKFHTQALKGIEIHDKRTKDVSHTNPDIDREQTDKNYFLASSPSYQETTRQHIASLNLKKTVRKDAVVMCQALITSDKAFFDGLTPDKEARFFSAALDFIEQRYGAASIVSAVVHKDEKTPHLHINFTPVRDGRLSAKAIFTKAELTELQTAFTRDVGAAYGLIRGESREIKRRHLATEAFKLETGKVLQDHVTAQDLIPKTLKKGILTSIIENQEMVAARINKEFLNPLVAELQKFQLEHQAFNKKLAYYKGIKKQFNELTYGLSPESVGELLKISEKLLLEQKEEIAKRVQQQLERGKSRGYSR